MDPRDDYRFPSRLKWLTWALAVIAIVALLMGNSDDGRGQILLERPSGQRKILL